MIMKKLAELCLNELLNMNMNSVLLSANTSQTCLVQIRGIVAVHSSKNANIVDIIQIFMVAEGIV